MSRHSVSTVSSNDSGRHSIWDASSPTQSTPFTSPPSGLLRANSQDSGGSLLFIPPIIVAFAKGKNLFKVAFARIDICKDAAGGIRKIEMSADAQKTSNVFILTFPNSRIPIPHLEQPYASEQRSAFRISFIEEQTLQTGGSLFQAKPSFAFERWEDCLRFQQAVLGQEIIFVGGLAEAKSKGRGEECISQNLRVLRPRGGGKTIMIFYTNSQRGERRKYISIPLNAITDIESGRKARHPITIKLRGETELLASLKTLQVQFLDDQDHLRFLSILRR